MGWPPRWFRLSGLAIFFLRTVSLVGAGISLLAAITGAVLLASAAVAVVSAGAFALARAEPVAVRRARRRTGKSARTAAAARAAADHLARLEQAGHLPRDADITVGILGLAWL